MTVLDWLLRYPPCEVRGTKVAVVESPRGHAVEGTRLQASAGSASTVVTADPYIEVYLDST